MSAPRGGVRTAGLPEAVKRAADQSMIPKSGYRFSEKIMLTQ
jgi:hypothetical protein